MNWDINYYKVKDKDGKIKHASECLDIDYCLDLMKSSKNPFPFPKEWEQEHNVALVTRTFKKFGSNGKEWQWQITFWKEPGGDFDL